MSRRIHWIIIHQSASSNPKHDNPATIERWHRDRGFSEVGYHFLIDSKGILHKGRDENKIGAHTLGNNRGSLGICLLGLFDKSNPDRQPTPAQFKTLEILLIDLCSRHDLKKSDILGHSDLSATLCPGFDLHGWLSSLEWH
jgi:N-acetylmuramoyl-L-alanine amidase